MKITRQARIEARLQESFAPFFLKIENESVKHSGHIANDQTGETHFRIIIGASCFSGQTLLTRERAIHQALAQEWQSGLHALSLQFVSKTQID